MCATLSDSSEPSSILLAAGFCVGNGPVWRYRASAASGWCRSSSSSLSCRGYLATGERRCAGLRRGGGTRAGYFGSEVMSFQIKSVLAHWLKYCYYKKVAEHCSWVQYLNIDDIIFEKKSSLLKNCWPSNSVIHVQYFHLAPFLPQLMQMEILHFLPHCIHPTAYSVIWLPYDQITKYNAWLVEMTIPNKW